jgi:hypothetical protein
MYCNPHSLAQLNTHTTSGSWGNQVGNYQYYIHGSGAVTKYVNLSPSYKNPADTNTKQGVKITIDNTAKWNSDMWRTELIPQTKAAINSGTVYYHFSIKRSTTNVPSATNEHQICFFESHFTELKYGWVNGESGTSNTNLQWMVGGQSKWKVQLDADVWHNVAYEIVCSDSLLHVAHKYLIHVAELFFKPNYLLALYWRRSAHKDRGPVLWQHFIKWR